MKKIAIVGKGASGKDFLKNILIDKYGFIFCIPYTTRPPRPNEQDKIDYYFESDVQFNDILYKDTYIISDICVWEYGMFNTEFEKGNLIVLTPKNIREIHQEYRDNLFVIYLNCEEELLRKRMSNRVSQDDMERRIASDRDDFKDFLDYDVEINGEFSLHEIDHIIHEIYNKIN